MHLRTRALTSLVIQAAGYVRSRTLVWFFCIVLVGAVLSQTENQV